MSQHIPLAFQVIVVSQTPQRYFVSSLTTLILVVIGPGLVSRSAAWVKSVMLKYNEYGQTIIGLCQMDNALI